MKLLRRPLLGLATASILLAFLGGAALPLAAPAVAQAATGLPDFTELVERTSPSVVNIRTTQRASSAAGGQGMDDEMQELFRRFFGVPPGGATPGTPNPRAPRAPNTPRGGDDREMPRGVGSGFILSADGFVMTNHHVVDGADEIYVTLTDKREFKGKVIGSDQRTDVAIVKIEVGGLPAVKIGDVGRTKVGEWVLAIGSPFGLDSTVTAGIVSAKQRETGDLLPFIQTDVAVNPGNSGGPLINMRGEVIGVNSQILSRTGTFAGVSFSIPIDEAMRVGDQLRATGRVTRGRMGVEIGDVTKEFAESIGFSKPAGAAVSRVEKDSPADKAGVEAGDIILKFEGKTIERSSELRRFAANTRPGTKVNIEVWRKGKTRELSMTLAELEPVVAAARRTEPNKAKPDAATNAFGIAVVDLTEEQKKTLRLRGGASVESVDGAAARAELRVGDVILGVQDTDITDAKQFSATLNALPKDRAVRMLVRRGEQSRWIIVRPTGAK
jgi:serine protease Do